LAGEAGPSSHGRASGRAPHLARSAAGVHDSSPFRFHRAAPPRITTGSPRLAYSASKRSNVSDDVSIATLSGVHADCDGTAAASRTKSSDFHNVIWDTRGLFHFDFYEKTYNIILIIKCDENSAINSIEIIR
jgi:hypothetical protein